MFGFRDKVEAYVLAFFGHVWDAENWLAQMQTTNEAIDQEFRTARTIGYDQRSQQTQKVVEG